MKEHKRMRPKHRKALSERLATVVKEMVEHELGPIPIPRMEGELARELEDWIYEFDSECHLAHKIENDCVVEGVKE